MKSSLKQTVASLISLLALVFTAYMVVSSAMTPKPVMTSINGREYPAPDKNAPKPVEPKKNSIEILLGDKTARLQLEMLRVRVQAAVNKRRAEEAKKRTKKINQAVPETKAMEAFLLAQNCTGVSWSDLAATHKQETLGGKFLGQHLPKIAMPTDQYEAFEMICQATGRDPEKQVCSSKGAIGQMQFMPKTWLLEGRDGNKDGVADPWCMQDAALSAAYFLVNNGYHANPEEAIASYLGGSYRGPAVDRYVAEVKAKAAKHGRKHKKDH